jgi:adenine-specific DNA-methyltransferase
MMRDRLLAIKTLLSPDGSVWVHCDDGEQAYLKVMMDEVFGRENFVGVVLWIRRNDPRNTARHMSADHDYLVIYAKELNRCRFNQLPRTDAMTSAYSNPDGDARGPWRRGDLAARNYYSQGLYPITTPSGRVIEGPPSGSYWRVSQNRLAELAADNRIYWGPAGNSRPYLKRFLSEVSEGRVPGSVWSPEEVGFVRNGKEEVRRLLDGREPFSTPKPERLLNRLITIATDLGDVVLDCFLGSGTTSAVAHKLGRRWIGVEWSSDTLDDFAIPRMTKVVEGQDPGGITKSVEWKGGGGFRVLEVAPSMFSEVDGHVFLSDWASDQQLAEATAAQLHFEFRPDPPFSGRKGRSRLAVVDGLINESVVRLLVGALQDGETVVVCGTAVDPKADEALKTLRPGSAVRKIPQSLLRQYRQRRRWLSQPAVDRGPETAA